MLRERVSVDIQGHVWLAWGLCPAADNGRDGVGGCCCLPRLWSCRWSAGLCCDDSGVVRVASSRETARARCSSSALVCSCWLCSCWLCCIEPRSRIQEVTVWWCRQGCLNWNIAKPCSLHSASSPFRWSRLLCIMVAAITHTAPPPLPLQAMQSLEVQRTARLAASLLPPGQRGGCKLSRTQRPAAGDWSGLATNGAWRLKWFSVPAAWHGAGQ